MTKADYARMSTSGLTQTFIEEATRVRGFLNFGSPMRQKTPETEAIAREIKTIAMELAARKPIAQARALMDHDRSNVGA